jgi:hypothetical protein
MFDFIKKLFGGIAAFFGGLFGGKKSQGDESAPMAKKSKGYFLELDDTGNVKSDAPAPKSQPLKAKAPESAVATLERPKTESATKEVPSGNQTVKIEAQPNPPAAASNGRVATQGDSTFAPKYLMPTASNSRRRPGPSMEMFKDMARQVKTR